MQKNNSNPPRPGEPKATEQGCTCPVIDNYFGRGRGGNGEKYGWFVSEGCPIHATTFEECATDYYSPCCLGHGLYAHFACCADGTEKLVGFQCTECNQNFDLRMKAKFESH